jgi:putative transposase
MLISLTTLLATLSSIFRDMGIHEVLSTPRSPWQRACVERVIGSIRRERLDHVLVFHETSLRRILRSYLDYYHRSRTHLSLGKDSPEPRTIQPEPMGRVVALPQVGGLHHRYERRATWDPALLKYSCRT